MAAARAAAAEECAREQRQLILEHVVQRQEELAKHAQEDWHSSGCKSISPYCPTTSKRIPHIFRACRLRSTDVVYDLGCGDGRILHMAAAELGCRCVGVEVDPTCLELAKQQARTALPNREHLCSWLLIDLLQLPTSFLTKGILEDGRAFPAPTVVVCYLTGHGLVQVAEYLHRAWQQGHFCIVTCHESLDTAIDSEAPLAIFDDTNRLRWPVSRKHAAWGVYVVPPFGTSVSDWEADQLPSV